MLSIDFGNNYTKVGFRKDENTKSVPLTSRDLRLDDYNICVPTLAASQLRDGKETWLYGTQVLSQSRGASMQVYRNWKPNFFRDPGDRAPDPDLEPVAVATTPLAIGRSSPLASLSTLQLIDLIGSGDLKQEQLSEVAAILREREQGQGYPANPASPLVVDTEKSSRGLLGWLRKRESAVEPMPSTLDPEIDAKAVGLGFFTWLREFIEPICQVNEYGSTREIPVRITMPSFGVPSEQARLLLEDIMQDAGWRLAETQPVLTEPVANLIGTISEGRNVVWEPDNRLYGRYPRYSDMFDGTFLGRVPRRNGSPIHWIMIADLGGFTADFAMVGYNMETLEIATAKGDGDGRLLYDHSEPIGVHDLDRRIREVLNPASIDTFDRIMSDPDGQLLERFHKQVFQASKPYMSGGVKINSDAKEQERIRDCIQQFADEVAGFAEHFRDLYQFDRIDELILTGGGCNIPQVRDAIRERPRPYALTNTYIPCGDKQSPPPQCQRLSGLLVRGATAIGGTSVFFDYPM